MHRFVRIQKDYVNIVYLMKTDGLGQLGIEISGKSKRHLKENVDDDAEIMLFNDDSK